MAPAKSERILQGASGALPLHMPSTTAAQQLLCSSLCLGTSSSQLVIEEDERALQSAAQVGNGVEQENPCDNIPSAKSAEVEPQPPHISISDLKPQSVKGGCRRSSTSRRYRSAKHGGRRNHGGSRLRSCWRSNLASRTRRRKVARWPLAFC